MRSIKGMAWCIVLLICGNAYCMEQGSKEEWETLSIGQKLQQKELLRKSVNKLRAIKRKEPWLISLQDQAKASGIKPRLSLKKKFSKALLISNYALVESLLNSDNNDNRINVNKPVACSAVGGEKALPIIIAASVIMDINMVELLLNNGAQAVFSNGSLIYLMLDTFNNDEGFWMTNCEVSEQVASIRHRYLNVLEYLFRHYKFNKNKDDDSKKCTKLWLQILDKASGQLKFLDKRTLGFLYYISDEFFMKK